MLNKIIRSGAALLLAGVVAALGGCADNAKPLEQLSEQDASKKANDMFREKMGQMGKGASEAGTQVTPAGAVNPAAQGGMPPGVVMPTPPSGQ